MDLDPSFPVGQRIKLLRERRGLSRAVVAGLCGRSESWLKKIEQGTRQAVRLPTLLRLADVLRVNDLTELTGQQLPLAVYGKPTHEATSTVQQALTSYAISATPGGTPGGEKVGPPSTSELRRRLEDAFALWRTSRYPRAEVGALLPALLIDAQYAVRELNGPDRRTAYAVLAGVYHLAQKLLAYQPVPELVFLAADRGMFAAQEADDPEAIAASAWYLAHVFREAGHLDQADRVVRDAATLLNPRSIIRELRERGHSAVKSEVGALAEQVELPMS
jgi:transcriptional regulator with XRE-family HTH domain